MLNHLRRRMSPALVISVIALFVAIGGVAGALPGKNSVNSGDIKKNGVKSIDIKDDNVTGNDVKESTLEIPAAALPGKDVFGASVNNAGTVTAATLPGTTAGILGAGAYTVTFPRNIQGCVPVASASSFVAVAASTSVAGPNTVNVSAGDGSQGYNVVVTC